MSEAAAPGKCPCGGERYSSCCAPYLETGALPATAEALMRSRYTAYVRGRVEYLQDTHLPRLAAQFDPEAAREWATSARWQRLEIVHTAAGGPDDDQGVVEFIARYEVDGAPKVHHERSSFERQDGRWYYAHGQAGQPAPARASKVGRNEPCPCGSGRKFKKCCGRPGAA